MFKQSWDNTHMKKILALVAMVSAVACTSANASLVTVGGGGAVHSAYVNSQADVIDTLDVKFTPTGGTTFINPGSGLSSGVPRNAGDPFTYPNRKLNADPLDVEGGQGWTFFGLINNANTLEFTGTPIGGLINTNNAPPGRWQHECHALRARYPHLRNGHAQHL
jgi:hypothetical protein